MEGLLAETGKCPPTLERRPTLDPKYGRVWEAFWFLHASRTMGMEMGAIPVSEITNYWTVLGNISSLDTLEELTRLVRVLDVAFLNYHHEQQKIESERAARNAKSRPKKR